MTTPTAPEIAPAPAELSYRRTVDRRLVHRAAVSEVFVTDIQPLAAKRVRAAVQLPLSHAYYSDHLQRPAAYDALLLLESGRQAAIAGSHTHIGLSEHTTMIVDAFRIDLRGPKELLIGAEPGRLLIDTEYIGRPTRRGRYRKGTVAQRYSVDGTEVGEHEMDVLFLTRHENEVLRHAQRGTPAPLTSDFGDQGPAGDDDRAPAPALVGRGNPLNVVLSHVEDTPGAVAAVVAPRFDNRALFDHVYDHLPAMTLVEAARQLALLATGGPRSAYVVGFEARFARFAELDAAVRAEAPRGRVRDGRGVTPVRFLQAGAEIARVSVTVADGGGL
ncbi:AfsA-related hotdog domain-containing protein [Streptomyces sp. ODS05-4]|uniref:AfsA-related hotdog domain-containing protein n=1 Tax=Streptomyces sp. ODS05-4 TaxID=2944939 RepID=UPI00210C4000|nr:AfsA-related hotdog domain-containing protein [Streptomyces sp. ODS05-4]